MLLKDKINIWPSNCGILKKPNRSFYKQNSAGFVPVLLGTVFVAIGLAVGYTFIERKYRVN